MKLLSTRTHGILDYLTAGTLMAMPRAMGWSENVTRFLTGAAVGTIGYSLLTRYEFGAVKVLPMRAHLALDAFSGVTLAASPLVFPDEEPEVKQALIGLGLFEIAAALTTDPVPRSAHPVSGEQVGHETADTLQHAAFGRVRGA